MNLIEHIVSLPHFCFDGFLSGKQNAEIGLGTISSMKAAKQWLQSTFLAVRLRKNPQYYSIEGVDNIHDTSDIATRICNDQIRQLKEAELVTAGEHLQLTKYGLAMASYFVKFETMKVFLALPPQNSKLSEMVSFDHEFLHFH
jgi:ATP-dependent DNA helicase HFM1/MER3